MTTASTDVTQHQADDRFAAGLRSAGLKLTSQRGAICRALAHMSGHHHPTVHDVYESARRTHAGVSLATVYNTLSALRDQGLLYELGPDADGAVHYELNTEAHVNVVCVRCKQIVDLDHSHAEDLQGEVSRQTGFRIIGGQFLYYGFCPACAQGQQHVAD